MDIELTKAEMVEVKQQVAEASTTTKAQQLLAQDIKQTTTTGSLLTLTFDFIAEISYEIAANALESFKYIHGSYRKDLNSNMC